MIFNTSATGAATASPVKNFPLLIQVGAGNPALLGASPGGADIRFTDSGGVELPCHIARWDTGFIKSAQIWVNVPEVAANSKTDFVVMWWGNPKAPAMPGSVKVNQGSSDVFLGGDVPMGGRLVFDTAFGFVGAWHLDEDSPVLKGTTAAFKDASQAANHGDDSVSAIGGTGVVGHALQFNPVTLDFISIKNAVNQQAGAALSFSAWIKGTRWSGIGVGAVASQVNPIVRKGDANPNPYQFCVSEGKLSLALDTNDNNGAHGTKVLETGKWIHVGGVWDGKTIQLFQDGKLDTAAPPGRMPAIGKTDARQLYIGGRTTTADASSLDLFEGAIDEVEMSNVARGKDWMRLSYENQKPGSSMLSFLTIAAPKDTVPKDTVPKDTVPKEDYSKWAHSRKISFNTSATGADVKQAVTDIPILLRLSSANLDFSQPQPNGVDLRFADPDGTQLPWSQVAWTTSTPSGEVWVLVPKVDGASKTDYITMYWGKADAVETHRSGMVFDTAKGWSGVWHMQNSAAGKGTAKVYKDATDAHNDGDDLVTADTESGLIGRSQRFGPAFGDCIRITSSPTLQPAKEVTFSAWVKADSWDTEGSGNVNTILRKGDTSPNAYQFQFRNGIPGVGFNVGEGATRYATAPLSTKTWHHVGAIWGKDAFLHLYVDGADMGGTQYTVAGGIGKDDRPLYIGGREATANDSGDQFKGLIDEVQFSRVEHTADWMKLAYECQRPDSKLLEWDGLVIPPDTTKPKDTTVVVPHEVTDTVLAPGQTVVHGGVYQISNPAGSDASVRIRFLPVTDRGDRGIDQARETIRLEQTRTGVALPNVLLEANGNLVGGMTLFRVLPGIDGHGLVYSYGEGIGSWSLNQPGDYFLGKDTLAPVIRFLDEGVDDKDSSWIEVAAEDNVANLILNIAHTRNPDDTVENEQRRIADGIGNVRLAYPAGTGTEPQLLSLRLWDGSHDVGFPGEGGGFYQLRRRLRDAKAKVDLPGNLGWRFLGIPLGLEAPMTLQQAAGAGNELFGAAWVNDFSLEHNGSWNLLGAADTLPTGQGIWLAARAAQAQVSLGDGKSNTPGEAGVFRMHLDKGWNQVTCPGLKALPWPIAAGVSEARDKSGVKALLAPNSDMTGYVESDSLQPWQGYFVHAHADTTVELVRAVVASKRSAAGNATGVPLQALLEPLPGSPGAILVSGLRLGAAAFARDGMGVEDEPAAPAIGTEASLAWRRAGNGLRTDLVGWRGSGEYAWKLAWGADGESRGGVARMRLADLRLPTGMSMWVASPLRKLAEPVAAGAEIDVLADAADTLVFWAAPAGRAFAWGGGFMQRPAARSVTWIRNGAGGRLRVALPSVSGLRADCHDLSGRRLGSLRRPALAPGYYEFAFAPRGAGLRIVTVEFTGLRGDAGPTRLTFKIAGP